MNRLTHAVVLLENGNFQVRSSCLVEGETFTQAHEVDKPVHPVDMRSILRTNREHLTRAVGRHFVKELKQ